MLYEIIMLTIIIYYTYYGIYTEPDAEDLPNNKSPDSSK